MDICTLLQTADYTRVVSVNVVLKLMTGDRRQLIDSRLGQTELVDAFRQIERPDTVCPSLVGEVLSTAVNMKYRNIRHHK